MPIVELTQEQVDILNGAGGKSSPFALSAKAMLIGTKLAELIVAVNAIADGGGSFDTIAEVTSGAGVTIDGLLIKDERIQPTGSGVATGDAGVTLKDNLASAWDVKEGANSYMVFNTGNDLERITLGKLLTLPVQVIDMADAQVALVLGTAGAGQVKLTGQILFVDANSAGTEDLLLPPEASSTGLFVLIANTGGEDIILKDDGDAVTVATISTTECAFAVCNGTTWLGGVVKLT